MKKLSEEIKRNVKKEKQEWKKVKRNIKLESRERKMKMEK